jgi:hypothetical protein
MTTNILTENGIESNTIILNTGTSEMLRVARDGFYVRGKRVNQDDKEAEIVYNAFSQWLTWATLNRTY